MPDFSKTTHPAVRNSSGFSTKISVWICWDVGVKITCDFQTSGLHNCLGKVAQIATKRLSIWLVMKVRHRELWIRCNTEVAFAWCCFSRQKELCSPPRYLNYKLNGKRLNKFRWKNERNLWRVCTCSFWKIVSVSYTKFVQFVDNAMIESKLKAKKLQPWTAVSTLLGFVSTV